MAEPLKTTSFHGDRITYKTKEGHVIDNVALHFSVNGWHYHAFDEVGAEIYRSNKPFEKRSDVVFYLDVEYPGITIRDQSSVRFSDPELMN